MSAWVCVVVLCFVGMAFADPTCLVGQSSYQDCGSLTCCTWSESSDEVITKCMPLIDMECPNNGTVTPSVGGCPVAVWSNDVCMEDCCCQYYDPAPARLCGSTTRCSQVNGYCNPPQ